MKKLVMILVAMALTFALASPAMANITINDQISINYAYADGWVQDIGRSLTSPYASSFNNFAIDTFEGGTTNSAWTYSDGVGGAGNFSVRKGDERGIAAAPWSELDGTANNTFYLAVPKDKAVGPLSVTVDFGGGSYDYLGLQWGSMDDYNTIYFMNNGQDIVDASISGVDALRDEDRKYLGNQKNYRSNAYVNIFTDFTFDAIRIESTNYAFELDNLAVATVPVPGAFLLGGIGASCVGWMRRRKSL